MSASVRRPVSPGAATRQFQRFDHPPLLARVPDTNTPRTLPFGIREELTKGQAALRFRTFFIRKRLFNNVWATGLHMSENNGEKYRAGVSPPITSPHCQKLQSAPPPLKSLKRHINGRAPKTKTHDTKYNLSSTIFYCQPVG